MREELIQLADTYLKAGEAIHDAIRESIRKAGGFLNCSNNDQEKKDMNALVFDSKKGYSETYPIRAMKLNDKDQVEGLRQQERVLRDLPDPGHEAE